MTSAPASIISGVISISVTSLFSSTFPPMGIHTLADLSRGRETGPSGLVRQQHNSHLNGERLIQSARTNTSASKPDRESGAAGLTGSTALTRDAGAVGAERPR